ncbi:MAG: DUF2294 domain-containing protein [Desulfobacterales bacterium]|jgi:uncharacterized protein YbcI|nr:DUF2294 domain-containing protein [Desulfobacterales bacterium]
MNKTRGQIESEISEAVTRFEKEYMGRGPLETKTYLIEDMVLVRLKGVLTPAEHHLAETAENSGGRELIKRVRVALIEKGRPLLQEEVEGLVRVKVKSLHTDISTVTGERFILFTLASVPSFR